VSFSTYSDRHRFAPWVLFGGGPGAFSGFVMQRDGEEIVLPSKANVDLRRGDRLVIEIAGGTLTFDDKQRPRSASDIVLASELAGPLVMISLTGL
jgi:N-methylhydantoinase B/oxoprolinase/acetone carboxylase alpha subunit